MIQLDIDKLQAIKDFIDKSYNILIVAHKNPDWDTIWSTTAFYEYLKYIWKKPTLVCESSIPDSLSFIPNTEFFERDFDLKNFDIAIICDAWAKHIAWFYETHPELFEQKIPVINLDHHLKNDCYWTINIIEQYAATTCLVYEIFRFFNVHFTPTIATSLLTWIYTDTWSFMHSNTDSYTLRVAAELLRKWANLRYIYKYIFRTIKISTLKLWWQVLKSIYKNDEGIIIATVTEEDFKQIWASYDELTWVVDYVNSVPNSKFSILLTERNWKVKWSLRTLNNDIDLTEIAWRFWWWWHRKAAWFTIWGRLKKELAWKIVKDEEEEEEKVEEEKKE